MRIKFFKKKNFAVMIYFYVLKIFFYRWEKKLPMSKSSLESTWLYHEIGRCYLEIGKYDTAKSFGEKSMVAAEEAEDQMWQLQASVLVAQSEGKIPYYIYFWSKVKNKCCIYPSRVVLEMKI
jgi:hypothetical protein